MKYTKLFTGLLLLLFAEASLIAEDRNNATEVLDSLTELEQENARLKRQLSAQREDIKEKNNYIKELTAEREKASEEKALNFAKDGTRSISSVKNIAKTTAVNVLNSNEIKPTLPSIDVPKINSEKIERIAEIKSKSMVRIVDEDNGNIAKSDNESPNNIYAKETENEIKARSMAWLARAERDRKLKELESSNRFKGLLDEDWRTIERLIVERDELFAAQKQGYLTISKSALKTRSGVTYENVKNAFKVSVLDSEKYEAFKAALVYYKRMLAEDIRILKLFSK